MVQTIHRHEPLATEVLIRSDFVVVPLRVCVPRPLPRSCLLYAYKFASVALPAGALAIIAHPVAKHDAAVAT